MIRITTIALYALVTCFHSPAHSQDSLVEFVDGQIASADQVNGNFTYIHSLVKEFQNQSEFVEIDCSANEGALKAAMEAGHSRITVMGGRCEAGTATSIAFDDSGGIARMGMYEIRGAGDTKPVLFADGASGRFLGGSGAQLILDNLIIETGVGLYAGGFAILRNIDLECNGLSNETPTGDNALTIGIYASSSSVIINNSTMSSCSLPIYSIRHSGVQITKSIIEQGAGSSVPSIVIEQSSAFLNDSDVNANFEVFDGLTIAMSVVDGGLYTSGSTIDGSINAENSRVRFIGSEFILDEGTFFGIQLIDSDFTVKTSSMGGGLINALVGSVVRAEDMIELGGLNLAHRGFGYLKNVPLTNVNITGKQGSQLIVANDPSNTHSGMNISGIGQLEFEGAFKGEGISINVGPNSSITLTEGIENPNFFINGGVSLSATAMILVSGTRTEDFNARMTAEVSCITQPMKDIGSGFLCPPP